MDGGSDYSDGIAFRLAVEAVSGASWVHLLGEWAEGGGCVNGWWSFMTGCFQHFHCFFLCNILVIGSETSSICFDCAYPIGESYLVMVDSVSEM